MPNGFGISGATVWGAFVAIGIGVWTVSFGTAIVGACVEIGGLELEEEGVDVTGFGAFVLGRTEVGGAVVVAEGFTVCSTTTGGLVG